MIVEFLDKRLIADWRVKIKKLWTVRLIALIGVVYSLSGVWTALAGSIPTWVYVTFGFLMNLILFVARVTKQPGVDE